jgi:NAD(P)H-dependent FMN reductase
MHIAIVCGSHRYPSNTRKIGDWLSARLQELWGDEVSLFDLGEQPLPFWDTGVWKEEDKWQEAWTPIATTLQEADALVFITPEWAGMATPAIKNFLMLCTSSEVGHKPGMAVGVSASRGGTWPIAELRSSSFKNNHLCWTPEHLVIRDAGNILSTPEPATDEDAYIRGRIDYALSILRSYGEALKDVRASGLIDHKTYPYGM